MQGEDTDENCENRQPVYAVFLPDDVQNSPRSLYSSLTEAAKFANSPEYKTRGARFRRFDNSNEAINFFDSRQASFRDNSPRLSGADPAVPFQAPTKIQMNRFKMTIEKLNLEDFMRFVDENPRFLVNTSGDCPAIVQEGFRYNVLHVGARVGAGEIVAKTLLLTSDIKFLVRLYGTNDADALIRRENIMTGFLCTPDKGNIGTPLVIALKFGHTSVVKAITEFTKLPVCDAIRPRLNLNIPMLLDDSILCSRYTGKESKEDIKKEIKLLFNSLYVPLYRAADGTYPAKVFPPTEFPRPILVPGSGDCLPGVSGTHPQLLACVYRLTAYAGPFLGEESAKKFYREWNQSGNIIKRSDMDKGFERVGRDLSAKSGVDWTESWLFLDEMCNVTTDYGLQMVEKYLSQLRLQNLPEFDDENVDRIRKRLFDDDDEDELEGAGDFPGTSMAEQTTTSEDEFCDASDIFFEDLEQNRAADDSLMGITERLDAFHIQSPPTNFSAAQQEDDEKMGAAFSDDDYDTPPPSPPPVFLLEEPTKMDNDLYIALSTLSKERLEQYPQVAAFVRQMSKVEERTRTCWPGTDSPRCPRTRSKQRLIHKRRLL
ncbi:unnamed protein product, partial [Mesorhabditis belari]|uniref:ANKLE2 third alpha/beta domain-containing protein n=1 Tax=Mesorhabditis belari TaxID=2138241 RepID=A0AAF3EKL2_9BILA